MPSSAPCCVALLTVSVCLLQLPVCEYTCPCVCECMHVFSRSWLHPCVRVYVLRPCLCLYTSNCNISLSKGEMKSKGPWEVLERGMRVWKTERFKTERERHREISYTVYIYICIYIYEEEQWEGKGNIESDQNLVLMDCTLSHSFTVTESSQISPRSEAVSRSTTTPYVSMQKTWAA